MWGRKKGTGGKGNEAKWERKGGGRGNRDGGWGKEREPGARGKEGLGEGRGGLGREEGGKREERGKEEGITGEGQGTGGEEEVGQWYWKGKVQEGSEGMEGKGSREEREGRGEGEGGGRRTGGGEYGRKVRRAEGCDNEEDDQEIDESQSDINLIRRSTRTRRAPDRICLYIDAEEHELGDLGEHTNYKAALLDPECDKWLNAMNVEI
ncbi:hypothetical protein Tco_1081527 [Tanacetum coccineum]|uniref:Uncharacterized protein n=1 Tax=Tanacetum coccineum TaxID=301880 RepID=A0ABQ5HZG6_9ASTR